MLAAKDVYYILDVYIISFPIYDKVTIVYQVRSPNHYY
jgi:hypothetical protein